MVCGCIRSKHRSLRCIYCCNCGEDINPALPELKDMKMELFKMEQYVEMVLTYLRMEDMSGDLQFEKVSLDKI